MPAQCSPVSGPSGYIALTVDYSGRGPDDQGDQGHQDLNNVFAGRWHRLRDGNHDFRLVERDCALSHNHCGTLLPVTIRGSHPTGDDEYKHGLTVPKSRKHRL